MSEPGADAQRASLRLAERDDNQALCELFASVTMDADLKLAVERDPDFFRLYDLQDVEQRTFVAVVDDAIEGLGTMLGRDGYLGGERVRVGYAGDLRATSRVRGGWLLNEVFGPNFKKACEAFGCEVMYTAILAANKRAIKALVERSPRRPAQPVYRPWRQFEITNLHFTRRRAPRATDLTVRRAEPRDLAAVADLLARDHAQRPFGYVFDEGVLRQRIADWPNLEVDSFYLAFRGPRLVGVTAPWDAHPVKRFRVLAYHGSMRLIRRAFNLGAFVGRWTPLPAAGGVLRYAYLTHVSVVDEDPQVMAALLDRIYADLHGSGLNMLCACVDRDDPLRTAYARYQTTPIRAQLFTMSQPGSPWNDRDPGPGRPGFEMALV